MKLEKINKWIDYFKNLDLFSQMLLLFAASQIIVAIVLALKQYNIFDITPYLVMMVYPMWVILNGLLIVGTLGIIYMLIVMSFTSPNQKSESKSNNEMEEIKIVK